MTLSLTVVTDVSQQAQRKAALFCAQSGAGAGSRSAFAALVDAGALALTMLGPPTRMWE